MSLTFFLYVDEEVYPSIHIPLNLYHRRKRKMKKWWMVGWLLGGGSFQIITSCV